MTKKSRLINIVCMSIKAATLKSYKKKQHQTRIVIPEIESNLNSQGTVARKKKKRLADHITEKINTANKCFKNIKSMKQRKSS